MKMPLGPTLIVSLMLGILALLFSFGKGAEFISGYSLMDEKQKSNINQKKLTKDMSIFLYSLIAFIIICHILYQYEIKILTTVIIVFLIIFVCIVNISLIFKNKKRK